MLRSIFFGLAGLLLVQTAAAQDVTVQASVSSNVLGTGETLVYTITVDGASFNGVQRPEPPATSNLALVQSTPSTTQSTTIVNGRMRQSIGFRWSLRPLREGQARIESATVVVGDEMFRTEPIVVEVVPQSQRPQRSTRRSPFGRRAAPDDRDAEPAISDDDIFIRAIPSKRTAYQNEPVTITYHLYFRDGVQLRQSRLADSWDAEGFWREDLEVDARPLPRSEVVDGVRYRTIVLKRAVVFPTRTGTLTVDPLRIETEVYVPTRSNDPFERLFSLGRDFRPIELSSPSVTIEARPLPDGAPPSFQGAVGDFELDVTASRDEVAVGDAVEVQVQVQGTGNIATLEAPELEVPGVFESYDPQVETSLRRSGSQIRGTKTFTYTLVPRSNGTFELPPVRFSFFDADAATYRTTSSAPLTLDVTGSATAPPAASTTGSGLPVDDIAPVRSTATSWHRLDATPLHRNPWVYVALLAPWLAVAAVLAWRRRADHLAAHPELQRRRRAHPEAQRRLAEAQSLLDDDARAFYASVEHALVGFVSDRLDVAGQGLTREQLDDRLREAGVPESTRKELTALLDHCDRGRFAPTATARSEREATLTRARDTIADLDAALHEPSAHAA